MQGVASAPIWREIEPERQTRMNVSENEVDDSQADAKYENRVLNLTLPKKKNAAAAKKLEVNRGSTRANSGGTRVT